MGTSEAPRDPPSQSGLSRRRWVKVFAVGSVAFVLLIGLAINRLVFAYAPLEAADTMGYEGDGRSIESFDGDSLLAFTYGAGAEFSYEFNFRNDGSRSVSTPRIQRINQSSWFSFPIRQARSSMG